MVRRGERKEGGREGWICPSSHNPLKYALVEAHYGASYTNLK